jgi:hypothetical protein
MNCADAARFDVKANGHVTKLGNIAEATQSGTRCVAHIYFKGRRASIGFRRTYEQAIAAATKALRRLEMK